MLHDTSAYPLNFLIFPHRLVANAYVGCQHDCQYCYAKWYTRKGQVTAKIDAAERLKQELSQLITHVQTLSKESTHLKKVYLVYNYDLKDYSDEVKRILNLPKLRRGITRYKIGTIGFPEVTSVLEKEDIGNQDFH